MGKRRKSRKYEEYYGKPYEPKTFIEVLACPKCGWKLGTLKRQECPRCGVRLIRKMERVQPK
jgi:DNA-directed RNA polymerase subunit RPC12/RpoP